MIFSTVSDVVLSPIVPLSCRIRRIQSREINSYYTYALVKVVVTNPPVLIRNAKFTEDAKELLVKHGWEKFEASYGAEYVDGYISGGSYYGLIEIQTTDTKTQRDVQAKLGGHYGGFKASAEFSNTFKEIAENVTMNVYVHRIGGDSKEPLATTVPEMIDQAKLFADQAKQYSVPFIAITSDYKSTIPLPDIQDSGSLGLRHQRDCLKELGERYLDLQDYTDTLKFVLKHLNGFAEFKGRDEDEVRKEFQNSLDSANQEIDEIVKKATACSDDFTKCELHTPKTQFLKLPGGDLMYLKELEEKLAQLETQISLLDQKQSTAVSLLDQRLSTRVDVLHQNVIYKDMPLVVRSFSGKYLQSSRDEDKGTTAASFLDQSAPIGSYEIMKISRYGSGW